MYVIPELQLKKFEHVEIPNTSDLFHRYGGSIADTGHADDNDFNDAVNAADRLDKVGQMSEGVNALREAAEAADKVAE